MSAAAARRRKQLEARKAAQDVVGTQLSKILEDENAELDEAGAYEALQLAVRQVRKSVHDDRSPEAVELSYKSALALLKKGRVSVASQMLTLLVEVLRETHTEEKDDVVKQLLELNQQHAEAMTKVKDDLSPTEFNRLKRLQREWILRALQWSSEIGDNRFGNNELHKALAQHCWDLSVHLSSSGTGVPAKRKVVALDIDDTDTDELADIQTDAVQHMILAEQPLEVVAWLKTLPAPTDEETKAGHTCPPALRDALLTRALLLASSLENLRDANTLLRAFIADVESRDIEFLRKSYTDKEDGKAPSHVMFGCMLLSILEKDQRTGPLFSWLMRSFKKELDTMYKPQGLEGFSTKIGKVFFNIQPPPNMLSMVENMMSGMGGRGGAPGGINPAMMQALAAQMQGGM